MSKLIVDQIQKSGGPLLSLPPVGNTPQEGDWLAVDAEGNLTFENPEIEASVNAALVQPLADIATAVNDAQQAVVDAQTAAANIQSKPPSRIQANQYGITVPAPSELMTGETGQIDVGECTNFCHSSCCCEFVVPAGVTEAQFQVWGAGGTGGGCNVSACCRTGAMGANGEYNYMWMSVAEGDSYTLCSGCAYADNPPCYSYYDCHGCNSFVCGSNNTCIMACGGFRAPNCHFDARETYPETFKGHCCDWMPAGSMVCTEYMYYGYFQNATPRYNGECGFGCQTTGNTRISEAKVPSYIGTMHKCSQCNTGYMCVKHGPVVSADHTISTQGNWVAQQSEGGCCWDTCSTWHKAGVGGMGMNMQCNYSSYHCWAGRGRAGHIVVKYK